MYEKVLVIYVLHMTGTISLSSTVNRTIKITVVIRQLTHIKNRGPGGSMSKVVGSNNSYKPIINTGGSMSLGRWI